MNPDYPVYIISKGRHENPLTAKALEKRNIPFHIVIEPQEYDDYAKTVDPKKIKVLPFSNLGQGSIPARNWVWEDSIKRGARRHWILDDNLRSFLRLYKNQTYKTENGNAFREVEQFADKYKNLSFAGMNYESLAKQRDRLPAVVFNHRVYSCILILNALSFRWRGRYNEDTDLCLRALKQGWCVACFNAFLCDKVSTMQMKGGNTDELYAGDGRLKMAQSLVAQHPDVTTIKWKFQRWQHEVNYKPFEKNKLVPVKPVEAIPVP